MHIYSQSSRSMNWLVTTTSEAKSQRDVKGDAEYFHSALFSKLNFTGGWKKKNIVLDHFLNDSYIFFTFLSQSNASADVTWWLFRQVVPHQKVVSASENNVRLKAVEKRTVTAADVLDDEMNTVRSYRRLIPKSS